MSFSFALGAPTESVEDANTCLAAATWMLENGVGIFSKKMNPDTGDWWVMLYQPTTVHLALSTRPGVDLPAERRVRGDGISLGDALIDAFEKMGIGGLRWKLHALERRMILLKVHLGVPPEPKKKKAACPHGVSGGRCRECV